ncbi:MAG: DUF1320 family protein [Salinivirgaceae bacterium]|jgi:hypothetical protein|nr:DUF1320 family protein [Salinivirgaceae bacterium]
MFLSEADLGQSIYSEIMQAISREDPNFIERNIALAIKQIDSKLSIKYDTTMLWAQTLTERNELILGIAIDFALYHCHAVLEDVPVIRRERYEYARKDLNDIMKGEIMITGVPLINQAEETADNEITSGTNSRRY